MRFEDLGGEGARAVLLDEPTANIDVATDEAMQRILREAFDAIFGKWVNAARDPRLKQELLWSIW